jgi:hypothetical protein
MAEWPKSVFSLALAAVGAWLAIGGIDLVLGYFILGLGIGALGTHLGSVIVRLRAFRIYRGVTDWSKVESTLAKDDVAI